MTIEEWLQYGIDNNFISQFCYMHDLPELDDEEAESFYDGLDDLCIPSLRVWL